MNRIFVSIIFITNASVAFASHDLGQDITRAHFVRIKAETFQMGSPLNEDGRNIDELQHQVTLTRDYQIMTTEVTQSQWYSVMGYNPSVAKSDADCPDSHMVTGTNVQLCPDHPVDSVYWEDIEVFLRKLNEKNIDFSYRLPTEAEWEFAARGGSPMTYSFGNTDEDAESYAVYKQNTPIFQTQPVGTKLPNQYGLYDMNGNVDEWVHDWYGEYSSQSQIDPQGPETGSHRVVRGGRISDESKGLRSARRDYHAPKKFRHVYCMIGFRLVRNQK